MMKLSFSMLARVLKNKYTGPYLLQVVVCKLVSEANKKDLQRNARRSHGKGWTLRMRIIYRSN